MGNCGRDSGGKDKLGSSSDGRGNVGRGNVGRGNVGNVGVVTSISNSVCVLMSAEQREI